MKAGVSKALRPNKVGCALLVGLFLVMSLVPALGEARPLRVGMLPLSCALPLLIAEKDDLYQEAGVQVETLLFKSSRDLYTAVMTGNIDVFHAGWTPAISMEQSGTDVAAVSLLAGVRPSEYVFAIMGSPRSSLRTVSDLEGATIATSLNSLAEYVVDRTLESAGIENFTKLEVPQMSLRLQMLITGQLQAAVFAEPMASLTETMGARRLIDTSTLNNAAEAIIFVREDVLERRPSDVKAFLRGFARAVAAINENPDAYKQVLVDELDLPASLRDSYRLVPLSRPIVPQNESVQTVLDWMRSKGLLQALITAQDMIRPEFLTEIEKK